MMWCVEAAMGVGPVGFSVEQQNLLWAMRRGGESIREMERTLGERCPGYGGFCVSRAASRRSLGSAGPII
jgi:hypothetical protein